MDCDLVLNLQPVLSNLRECENHLTCMSEWIWYIITLCHYRDTRQNL